MRTAPIQRWTVTALALLSGERAFAGPCTPADGACDLVAGEDDVGCPEDCGCQAVGCGNMSIAGCYCDPCCFDSGDCCDDADTVCGIVAPGCPDGYCDPICFENCENCPEDCGCTPPEYCDAGNCTSCGNGICDAGFETACTCEADCPDVCGDGCCTPGENVTTCWADCCGDGSCDTFNGETCDECFVDCCGPGDVCAAGQCTGCGNGLCGAGEDCVICPEDCPCSGTCLGPSGCDLCGNGMCDTGESDCNCFLGDCGDVCPDGCCTSGESVVNCPDDCPQCGDAICDSLEDCATCVSDCFCTPPEMCVTGTCTQCPNGACDGSETCASCPADCGACGEPSPDLGVDGRGLDAGADGPPVDAAATDGVAPDGPLPDAPRPDSNLAPDHGASPGEDAAADAGPPESEGDGGCSCRVGGENSSRGIGALSLLLTAVLLLGADRRTLRQGLPRVARRRDVC